MHTYVAQYYFFSGELPKPIGSGHQSVVPYQAFKTKDMYIVIAVYTDKFWDKLCRVLGLEPLIDDPKFANNEKRREHRVELVQILSNIFKTKSGDEWLDLLNKEGVPCAPINTLDKVFTDSHVLIRDMVVDVDVPHYGKLKMLGNPVKFKNSKDRFISPPKLGQHTYEILSTLLGMSDDEINRLKDDQII
jgi:crotonobetainyl-CoA:carnitine CoA-transferase CaiB-like acyl-CoA transferase